MKVAFFLLQKRKKLVLKFRDVEKTNRYTCFNKQTLVRIYTFQIKFFNAFLQHFVNEKLISNSDIVLAVQDAFLINSFFVNFKLA